MVSRSRIGRLLFTSAGICSFALGMIGLALPIMPTVPFLLLAAACFVRGSDRFYQWLINHRQFGPAIRNYREKKAVTRKVKIVSIAWLWTGIICSCLLFVESAVFRTILLCISVAVTIHLLRLKTL